MIEWDAASDLDVPAGDADFLDDESEQLLALLEVESGERCGGGGGGEGVDAVAEPVVFGKVCALRRETS